MLPEDLELKAGNYVTGLFARYPNPDIHFHTLEHTQEVAAHVREIGANMQVTPDDARTLVVAAWMHDTGHLIGGIEGHEERSVKLMNEFLQQEKVDDATFAEGVAKCILATKMPHQPVGLLEDIMCDADVFHFGTPEFRRTNKLVKKELEDRGYGQLTKGWLGKTLKMLEGEEFHTSYCKALLSAGRQENINWVHKKISEKDADKAESSLVKEEKHAKEKKKEKKLKAPTDTAVTEAKKEAKLTQSLIARGAQTLLRLGSSNHLTLSRMADQKANILISVNSIIISVLLSEFIDKLDSDPYLTIPTIIFLSFSVTTVIVSILATRPKLTEGSFSKEEVLARKTNLLFFGNFYRSSLEEYQWAMNKLLEDKEYIYGTMIMDIYYISKVLGRKYRLIRIAYNLFMVGIIVSVIAFAAAIILHSPEGHTNVIDADKSPT